MYLCPCLDSLFELHDYTRWFGRPFLHVSQEDQCPYIFAITSPSSKYDLGSINFRCSTLAKTRKDHMAMGRHKTSLYVFVAPPPCPQYRTTGDFGASLSSSRYGVWRISTAAPSGRGHEAVTRRWLRCRPVLSMGPRAAASYVIKSTTR